MKHKKYRIAVSSQFFWYLIKISISFSYKC